MSFCGSKEINATATATANIGRQDFILEMVFRPYLKALRNMSQDFKVLILLEKEREIIKGCCR